MSKLKIEFGFGTGFSGEGRSIPREEKDSGLQIIRARAVELFGGCTLTHTEGDWLDTQRNKVVTERGCTLSVLADMPPVLLMERVNAIVACIKDMLDQKAVAVTSYGVNFEIV
jgi:hypothetical protein